MTMATMNIKDPEVRELAIELARIRGVSMTEAVRQAIDEALRHDRHNDDDFVERLLSIGRTARAKADALGIRPLTDDEMYDEAGVPR